MKLDTVIAQSPHKTLYRDGNVVIKVFDDTFTAPDVLNEALNHAIVAETGFPVPDFVETAKINGQWAIISQFVEGATLLEEMNTKGVDLEEKLAIFVDLQIKMHTYSAPRLRHHTEKMAARIQDCELEPTIRYELNTRLSSLPRHAKLCHGDFLPSNIIIKKDGEAVVVDWAHATQGNASGDTANTYLKLHLAGRPDWADLYLDQFCAKSGTQKRYVQRWIPIVAANQLTKTQTAEGSALLRSWVDVVEFD